MSQGAEPESNQMQLIEIETTQSVPVTVITVLSHNPSQHNITLQHISSNREI